MTFIEGSRGIYQPIGVLFETPIYEQAVDGCWYVCSYKFQTAVMFELLRLQQEHRLTAAVTDEDMCELLVEDTRQTMRVQLWDWKVEGFDEDVQPLLKLVWSVNTSMKMRDVTAEAKRLLDSPEDVPLQFRNPKVVSEAQGYAKRLREQRQQQQQQPPQATVMGPREVVLEVVPKVLQAFWELPKDTALNMPSKVLSKMAVGATKAVEDQLSAALSSMLLHAAFSRSTRDNMVLSILETVRRRYTEDVLTVKLLSFDAELLSTITEAAAAKICELFEPQPVTVVPVEGGESDVITAEDVCQESGQQEDKESDSTSLSTTGDEPVVIQSDPEDSLDEAEEKPASGPELDTDLFPETPAPVSSADEAPAITDVQELTPDQTTQ